MALVEWEETRRKQPKIAGKKEIQNCIISLPSALSDIKTGGRTERCQ